MLPTDPNGRYLNTFAPHGKATAGEPDFALLTQSASDDPRLIRRLPWAGMEGQFGNFISTSLLDSFVLAFIPLFLVYRVVRNRTWSMRGMFVMTAAAAIAIGAYLILPDPYSDLSPAFGVAFRRLAAAIFFLPMTTFPYFLIAWTMQGRRRRIAWLLATTVLATAIAAAFMLAVDASAKSASQHYSWRAWWTIFIPAVWWAGALAYAVLIFNRPVRALYRRFGPAASDRSKLRDPT